MRCQTVPNLADSSNRAVGQGQQGGAASCEKNGTLDTPERQSLSARQAAKPLVQPNFMLQRVSRQLPRTFLRLPFPLLFPDF
jgi:hypothetical protein